MERVLILGATSAIAAEVAARHAARGDRLHLVGRSPDKLAAVVQRCAGTAVTSAQADLAELAANAAVVSAAITALGGLDRVLVAHGDLGDQLRSEHDLAEAERIVTVNLTSAIALLLPLANHLEQARAGRIGVIASVAGERGRPRNYTYGAAKAALRVYLQGLRTRLYGAGVAVTTLQLGPVDTPMTEGHTKHPLFGKVPRVADGIVAAMDARRAEVYLPAVWGAIMPIVRWTPEAFFQRIPFLGGR